ncbi:MAG: 4-(cytidine 5'-diphospho)-2-C-methyl-D-erythritol kinase [Burkholderiaceae bacterium]
MEIALALPAPAKLNLFVRITGRRADGYHELQSAFALIDLADLIDFERRGDGVIQREGDLIGAAENDLAVRAANALKKFSDTSHGVTISVSKRIPAGSGLGGGSSDAATTLLALNRLWDLHLPREQLSTIGLQLGADVPFFLHGRNALAEGIGERLTTIELPAAWYAIVWPNVHVSTKDIFADEGLTRNSKAMKIAPFSEADSVLPAGNDLEPVARRRYPVIDEAIKRLEQHGENAGAARMTGSGSAVFLAMHSQAQAQAAIFDLPSGWQSWVARGLSEHPLAAW